MKEIAEKVGISKFVQSIDEEQVIRSIDEEKILGKLINTLGREKIKKRY